MIQSGSAGCLQIFEMGDLENGIKRVNEKLLLLLKQLTRLQQENSKYRQMLAEKEQQTSGMTEKIDQLKQQVIILKAATHQLNEQDKKELDKRLNHYLKEIDRCINMLGQ